jgi:hypothetical protein
MNFDVNRSLVSGGEGPTEEGEWAVGQKKQMGKLN